MSVPRILRLVRACVHSACGGVAYRLGCHGTARRQFERVLLLRGADFRAYVHLGRIAFDLGDYAGWRREFEHARRTDPARFARLRHPMELFEPRLAGTRHLDFEPQDGFEGTDARATWRAARPFGGDTRGDRSRGTDARGTDMPLAPGFDPLGPGQQLDEPHEDAPDQQDRGDATLPTAPQHGAALPDSSLTRDDFSSSAERRRFQLRRPIDEREIARCNLEELLRRLSG